MNIVIVESETQAEIACAGHSLARHYGQQLQALNERVSFTVCEPYRRALRVAELEDVDGVVFPGAGVKWSVDAPQGRPVFDAMETAFKYGTPCFGSCNGLQLAGYLLGGAVVSGEPEVGVARAIALTESGRSHPMMRGRSRTFTAPTIHGDQLSILPEGAQHLAENGHTSYQAFAYERHGVDFWGVEYHPELSAAEIGRYLESKREQFADYQHLVPLLLEAEHSAQAAGLLGSSPLDLQMQTRTLELQNWLDHLEQLTPA